MSAIVGLVHSSSQPVDQEELARMVATLAHRGPDGSDMWRGGPVGLGHQMLHTTPESLHERLPLANRRGDMVITADARIDNRAELIDALGLHDRAPGAIADSELILAAYERWGEQCPARLLGDFAFAIWDVRSQTLFCARDHFGVRSLYYHQSPALFAFATEIKGLLALPQVPRRVSEARIADYLQFHFEDRVSTFYQDIVRLPPGHALTVRGGQLRTWRYYALELLPELRLRSDEAYAEAYRAIFTEAVRCRMRSLSPIGSMLSGGMDSSSVTCVARAIALEQGLGPIETFSAIFDEVKASDERPYMQAVIDQGHISPNFTHGDQVTPLSNLDQVLWHEDEPYYAPNLFINWEMWGEARRKGVRVLLDGIMGDSTAAHGFEYLGELAYHGRWLSLAREVRALGRHHGQPFWPLYRRYLWQEGLQWRLPGGGRELWRRWRGHQPTQSPLLPLINADFARRYNLAERIAQADAAAEHPITSARAVHLQGLTTGLITSALEAFDRGVAAFGIEARLPFMDRRLVELCVALPARQKFQDGWNRSMVRRGLSRELPEKVRLRLDKGLLGHNFRHGLAAERAQIEQSLQAAPELIGPYINVPALASLYQRFLTQDKKANEGLMVLLVSLILATWLREQHVQVRQEEVHTAYKP